MVRRGGGSRSRSSSRSSSRRSSRRSYRRNRGYYGGGYRRGYGRGYGSNQLGPGGIVLILLFVGIFVVVFPAAFIGLSPTDTYIIESQSTIAYDTNSVLRKDISIVATSGSNQITTYFFDSEPALSEIVSTSDSFPSESIFGNEFIYFEYFLNGGSSVSTSWSTNQNINFYFIEGSGNFNSWKDGNSGNAQKEFGNIGNVNTFAPDTDSFYFVFENTNPNTAVVDISFSLELATHDVSNAIDSVVGTVQNHELYPVVVVKNTGSEASTIQITQGSKFSFGTVFIIISALWLVVIVLIYRRANESHKKRKLQQTQQQNVFQKNMQTTQQGYQSGFQSTQPLSAVQTNQSGFVQRPTPMYCPQCGSGITTHNKFCNACGEKLT